ncbi:hypothetical protein D3C81_1226270 [compost metagenome]
MDALRLPAPAPRLVVVGQQLFLGQRLEELDDEERVSSGLVLHQPGQRDDARRRTAQGLSDQLLDVRAGQRRQTYLVDAHAGLADGL